MDRAAWGAYYVWYHGIGGGGVVVPHVIEVWSGVVAQYRLGRSGVRLSWWLGCLWWSNTGGGWGGGEAGPSVETR